MTSTELTPLVSSPAMNRVLLKNARRPIDEIAEVTGFPAGEVAERLEKLLTSADWRTDLMEEKLLLFELNELTNDIRERMQNASKDEDYGSMARAQLASIKLMLDQIEKRRKAIDGDLAQLTELQAKVMAMAIEVAMERAILKLEKRFPDYDGEVIRIAFTEELPGAVAMLEKHVGE